MGKHKEAAVSFLKASASGDVRASFARLTSPEFRHHNPHFKADAQSLMQGMEENAAENPAKELEVLRVLEDGELVAVHSRVRMSPKQGWFALAHIFRFEDERIAELWDIAQEAPAQSPNQLGMF